MNNNRPLNLFKWKSCSGFTMVETVVSLAILSLAVLFVTTNMMPVFATHTFKGQVQSFISTMQKASNAAARGDNRYEVIIDLTEQKYILRQIKTLDLENVSEDEIIETRNFGKNCRADYVIFDDLVSTHDDLQIAKFRAGKAGWQYGGKIVFYDQGGRIYSVLVSRLNRIVELKNGDVPIPLPKYDNELPY